jgi:hypothetical protein
MEPLLPDAGDLGAAIEACERELEDNADPAVIEQLAGLYARRDGHGDREQAADLYATLGDALGDPDGIPWLERALALVPSHDEARAALAQLTHAKRVVPRTGRTQVGFKVDVAAEDSAPLVTMDGTAIPSSMPPPAAEPEVADVSIPAAAAVPLTAASWPPVSPRRSVAPAAPVRKSHPPRPVASVPPQQAVAVATPVVMTKRLEDELDAMAGTKRAVPDKRWLIGGVVAACALVGAIFWPSTPAPAPVAAVPVAAPMPTPPSAAPVVPAMAAPAPAAAIPQVAPLTAEAIGGPAPTTPEPVAAEPVKSGPQIEPLWKLASVRGGKLADDDLAEAFEKAAPKLDRCYAQSLKKKPRTQGRITLGFMVRTNGRAMRVKPVSATIKDKVLSRCAAGAVAATRFPKPRKNATVRLPIEFSPG